MNLKLKLLFLAVEKSEKFNKDIHYSLMISTSKIESC